MKSFKSFINEESYIIPIKTVHDAKSFNSKMGFSDLEKILNKSFEILSKYPDASPKTYSDVPLVGGDSGGIKIRLNSDSKGFIEMKEYISSIGIRSISYGAGSIKFTEGVRWTTPVLETCLCLGVYINGDSLIRDFKAIKSDRSSLPHLIRKWSDIILSTLGNGEDWDSEGASAVIRFIKKGISVKDWVTLGMLANGMTTFANGPGKGLNHIVHSRVRDYYSAEESNHHIEVEGNKANTTDMILSSVPASELIKMVSSEEIRFDSNGMCYVGRAKFLQVSLKKSLGGAQLGKVTELIKNMYGVPPSSDILNSVFVAEGVLDFVKKLGNTASKYIQGVINKIRGYFNSFFKKVASGYDTQQKKDLVYLEQVLNLKEGSLYNGNTLSESKSTIVDTLRGLSENQVGIIVNEVEKRSNKLESTINGIGHITFSSKGRIIHKSTTLEDRIKLLANLTTFEILSNMLNKSGGDIKRLAEDIGSIQKEMIFGKTTLPLYKVHGSGPGEVSYEYLSTGKEFVNKLKTSAGSSSVIVMGVLISPIGSGSYYVMSSAFFVSVDENGDPVYSLNRMGTNHAGHFTYVFEGTKFLTLEEFNKNFR